MAIWLRSRRSLFALSLLSALACGGDSSSPTPSLTCPSATVPLCQDPTDASQVRIATADAVDRLLPTLSGASRSVLTGPLTQLSAALQSGDVSAARGAIVDLSARLAERRATALNTVPADLATIDAIGLAVLQGSIAVGGSVTVYPAGSPTMRPLP